MRATELIDFMMNLIIYPCMVILHSIVKQGFIHIVLVKPVDNLLIMGKKTKKKAYGSN